ncbi:MAG: AlwI family type II restriction endonuclease [Candidatus Moeniiplasma glomeromycotorum]|nr:AlwI family type II restriction endonuclease [Candidatus Moeniiplasma glomeromycotorum]MCE8167076.1 AlwI family type II restriction endonuclease [Candidatus Moeniiplasma glomeromycotorum]MCE8168912.1 AlwI family type II restriction endonuclease [Candidatus Moeniiplasma glomeromycotorum]
MKRNQLFSFYTTIRNPERYLEFLEIIKKFDNLICDEKVLVDIAKELISYGIYKPTKRSEEIKEKTRRREKLSSLEVEEVMKENPQTRYGGWAKRTKSHLKPLLELAFIKDEDNKITVLNNGIMLGNLNNDAEINDFWTKLLLKVNFSNPFRKSENKSNPFLLTLLVINSVNKEWKKVKRKATGISKAEFGYYVLSAKNNDYSSITEQIISHRKKFGISNNFKQKSFIQHLSQLAKVKEDEIKTETVKDYVDNVIRHFRLTGLISYRGGARFIDLSKIFDEEIKQIIEKNEPKWKEFSLGEYVGHLLEDKVKIEWKKDKIEKEPLIMKFVEENEINLTKVKEELLVLCSSSYKKNKRKLFSLKEVNIEDSLKLEFLVAIAFILILKRVKEVKIVPNLLIDDEGIPRCHAPGGKGDIEINYKNEFNLLVEVTLRRDKFGQESEVTSITRHEKELWSETNLTTYTAFVAPSIHLDIIKYLKWHLFKEDHQFDYHVFPISTKKFIEYFMDVNKEFEMTVKEKFSEFKSNKTDDLPSIVN